MAIELIGRGFTTWEPHINGTAIVRTLISSTGLAATTGNSSTLSNNISSGPSVTGGNMSTVNNSAGLSTGGSGTSTSKDTPLLSPTSASAVTNNGINHAIVIASRQAVVQIATSNTPLFISTITFDFVHSKSSVERICGLKLLCMFMNKV